MANTQKSHIDVFANIAVVPEACVEIVIANHTLEYTRHPHYRSS
jgi:hypothetical protein